MNNCKITFEEDDKKIVVDFTVDDNDVADYKITMIPEIKDKSENMGLKGYLCQLFLEAIHNGATPEEEPVNDEN